jgi:hypothetical protein
MVWQPGFDYFANGCRTKSHYCRTASRVSS